MGIIYKSGISGDQQDLIKGLLLTLTMQNNSGKANQIEEVAKSSNKSRTVKVTEGVHNHLPAPPGVNWVTIVLTDGDDTPEEIHIYCDDFGVLRLNTGAVFAINKPGGFSISVQNPLRQGLDWY